MESIKNSDASKTDFKNNYQSTKEVGWKTDKTGTLNKPETGLIQDRVLSSHLQGESSRQRHPMPGRPMKDAATTGLRLWLLRSTKLEPVGKFFLINFRSSSELRSMF